MKQTEQSSQPSKRNVTPRSPMEAQSPTSVSRSQSPRSLREHALAIATAGIDAVRADRLVREHLHIESDRLVIGGRAERYTIDLSRGSLHVVGAGKATAAMAQTCEAVLGERIAGGVIAVKYGHALPLKRIRTIEAGHPVPDEQSMRAGRAILEYCRALRPEDVLLYLASGGGSALAEVPVVELGRDDTAALAALQELTSALLRVGADIGEVNTVRRALSALKGGGVLDAAGGAQVVTLAISDVIGDDPRTISSGPTIQPTQDANPAAAAAILATYGLQDLTAAQALAGHAARTQHVPVALRPAPMYHIIGRNREATAAAARAAASFGYHVLHLGSRIEGEARVAARILLAIAGAATANELTSDARPPLCILAGGETTVTVRGSGRGGRNQEMALAALIHLQRQPELAPHLCFVAVGSDGTDGPTDAAGGYADQIAARASDRLSNERALDNNDSYQALEAAGALIKTGPTQTNVGDLYLVLAI